MTVQIKGPRGKGQWPRTITAGSASVKIYEVAQSTFKNGKAYMLVWSTPEGRRQQKFADPTRALEEGRTKAAQLAAGRIEASEMSSSDRDELMAARKITKTKETPLCPRFRNGRGRMSLPEATS